ncbi:PEP/pyruvate-binding domain-containing protein [Polyangium sorediatum]|uniref:PEP/pyruvate-binding domain-containing protein n=1 Tax=Polyangium sorediatum TaxID=889274 RepID=A0ABT6NSN8_9BACT|nr:PEP/pyruvate-binding domain-containing protein [Polyangium sorediatum]MDI1431354.1 PEP/pyruvate-binding domain-containing protein [Polyangium sorediatum]
MKRSLLRHAAFLLLSASSASALWACGDSGGNPNPGSGGGDQGGGGQGGVGPGGGDPGGGGQGGTGGFAWPVDTYPISITPSDTWKNQISYPYDPFLSEPNGNSLDGGVRWIKFTVLMHDPTKVYFQDSYAYPFHAPFAVERLDPFFGMSIAEYNDASLHAEGQKAILGAVLIPPDPARFPEYGIQLVRQDAYDPEMARVVLDLVKKNVVAEAPVTPFYFPTYEQNASAQENKGFFANAGFPVSSVERWVGGNQCYAMGWALGKLRYVPTDQIEAAYTNGTLKSEDILLTDAIPAELPYLAGIVSLSPSTPNAHTAILATSFNIPFVYLASEAERAQAKSLDGKEIILRAKNQYGRCDAALFDMDGALTAADRDALLAQKKPAPLAFSPKQTLGAIVRNTDDLGPADIVHFGGKAANYGLLRDAIPNDSQEALALSFDLWDGFLDQTMPGGKTLRQEIGERLATYQYPPNLAALKVDLAAIRARIEDDTTFSDAQRQAVVAALASFDPARKIRFRSSTNVEDSDAFTGAGLYDSASGCLADDTDADTTGPSHCEASQTKERGVFRALQKVYASFYNDNAFIARLLYGVNESEIGMGVLVHYSYPDEDELANGVATNVRRTDPIDDMKIVSQVGALSVTNPEGGALPEVVHGFHSQWGDSFATIAGSSLVPLGGHVMEWDNDYVKLGGLLGKVADRFAEVHPSKTTFALDYEYKKMKPNGALLIKQVRELPLPDDKASLTPFLVPGPRVLCTLQGEQSDVFALHRLKLRASLRARTGFVDAASLAAETLYGDVTFTYLSANGVSTLTGNPGTWPSAAHSFAGDQTLDLFTSGSGADARTLELSTGSVPTLLPPSDGPILALRDLEIQLAAEYTTPVPYVDWDGVPAKRTRDEAIRLTTCMDEGPLPSGASLQTRTIEAGGVKIVTKYYWPSPPTGVVAGYTAPLLRWEETRIEGLTAAPIVLKGHFSQTYRPQHHNFSEDFMFEPALEEGLPANVLAELTAKGIRQIYVLGTTIGTIDPAGQVKPL